MNHLIYILFGIAPSLIWLSFYLRKDVNPEPKKMILKVFSLGIGAGIIAIFIETFAKNFVLNYFPIRLITSRTFNQVAILAWGAALIEEFSKYISVQKKYFVAKNGILSDAECDEPLDLMLYMIVAALGFAALENVLKLYSENLLLVEAFMISSFRFIGAVLLHALCSGTLGFFIAISFFKSQKKIYFVLLGLSIATLLHGAFNYSIIKIEESLAVINQSLVISNPILFFLSVITLLITLFGLGLFVSLGFEKLKGMANVCRINPKYRKT